ncbi:hypothetical protein MVEN_02332600 [Mycena venus]|uniref:Uncharacterized protein n=1 Tax=Mycena venus TaxID=2733690 RepID=A0A8H7CDN9_9AGAR|nr:hypothetical protein MVEN_02332600 [Mycena venus]
MIHSLTPPVEHRRSAPIEPELAHDPVPKPRSRRCFMCGTMGRHPLDFRICPCTAVLLRRSLAKINEHGRLVLFDGLPLPMTRHPAGVAAHLISPFRNPTRIVPKPSKSPPAPRAVHILSHPVSSELHDRVPRLSCEFNLRDPACIVPQSPEPVPVLRIAHIPPQPVSVEPCVPPLPCEFNPSSLHAIQPVDCAVPESERIPFQRTIPSYDHTYHDPSGALSRARALWIGVLLDSLLNSVFQSQLRAILILLDRLSAEDPSTLWERIQPVFTRISHFIPVA